MENIPLETVVSHTPTATATVPENEKQGMFHRGRRRLQKSDSKNQKRSGTDGEDDQTALNRMGRIYTKILNFSIVTRYLLYVIPIAAILSVPIVLAKTVWSGKNKNGSPKHTIGGADETRFWVWIEIIWLSFWACKIVAHFLPRVFEFLVGVVSPGVRKYAQLLKMLEKSLALLFWTIVNQFTFIALIETNRGWRNTMQHILLACLVCAAIFLGERFLIQLISISYHKKQYDLKIKDSKRNIYLLGQLFEASRTLFPSYCPEFAEEDYLIHDGLEFGHLGLGSKKHTMSHKRSGTATPMRLLADVGRFGDKVTSAFGVVAQEITGKKILDPNSAHSVVLEALDRNRSAEALAKRIWMSFVVEGRDALYPEDLVEVMGPGRQEEAEECFSSLDRDGNGDISLEEMILTVTEFGRERKSIATSMHDVDQAINALDGLLFVIVFIVSIFVFICFLSPSFVGTLATSATAILSLSFVFASTCQEILGSCVFLFVKHPYDIGDRVDISTDELTVEHISLLYTVFKRVANGKMVQVPNIVLNSLWVENITRSKAMREQVSIFCAFGTTFEDINTLKTEMINFVRDPQNSRDFHPDIEIEVVDIAAMDKLELKCEIRHKSNWTNEALRSARRSKFMCALVLALRKVPISGPGGSDAALGDAGKPSWSVSIPPEEALAARQKFLKDQDSKRLYPAMKDDVTDKGKSSSTDYLSTSHPETQAMNSLNNRKPGVDPLRDDTWNARDDASTIGRPSMDDRPDLEEVRGMLQKMSSGGKRKQLAPVQSYGQSQPRQAMPPLPVPVNPSPTIGGTGFSTYPLSQYPQQQPSQSQTYQQPLGPTSPSSVSTGYVEEAQYQSMSNMAPPPRSTNRPAVASPDSAAYATSMNRPIQAPGSTNPYRSASKSSRPQSPQDPYPYRP